MQGSSRLSQEAKGLRDLIPRLRQRPEQNPCAGFLLKNLVWMFLGLCLAGGWEGKKMHSLALTVGAEG